MSENAVANPAPSLQQRLQDPEVAESLNRLLDRLDTVNFAIESMEGFISRGEVIADSLASGVAELKQGNTDAARRLISKAPKMLETGTKLADAAGSMNVDELARSRVLERLTDPETLSTVNRLLDRLPLAAFMMEALEGFIGRGETIADNLSEAVNEIRSDNSNIDLNEYTTLLASLPKFKDAAEKLMASKLMGEELPKVIEAGVTMVDSGMMDKEVVAILGDLGKKSAQTYREVAAHPVEPVGGLWATLKATKDPDVQKSVGFFFAFAKAFAKHLK